MKIIITGGGTGGHIIPAFAILDIIKESYTDLDILYIGSSSSLEEELAKKEGYPFKSIETGYLNRKLISLHNVKSMFSNIIGFFQSISIIKKFSPDIIIGTGGYVSAMVVLAGKTLNKPVLIHEQNAYPGITNKIAGKFADKIMISFHEAEKFFKNKDRIVFTGNPVRKEFSKIDLKESRDYFNLKDSDFFVYSFGGSGGQRFLNEAIINSLESIGKRNNLRWLHVTGKNHYDNVIKQIENKNIELPDNINILKYMYNPAIAIKASNLVIGSAGAISIAEIIYLNKPCILIPKRYTAENHQYYNAKEIKDRGAGLLILEEELTSTLLLEKTYDIIDNDEKREEMIKCSKSIDKIDFSGMILETVVKTIRSEANE